MQLGDISDGVKRYEIGNNLRTRCYNYRPQIAQFGSEAVCNDS